MTVRAFRGDVAVNLGRFLSSMLVARLVGRLARYAAASKCRVARVRIEHANRDREFLMHDANRFGQVGVVRDDDWLVAGSTEGVNQHVMWRCSRQTLFLPSSEPLKNAGLPARAQQEAWQHHFANSGRSGP